MAEPRNVSSHHAQGRFRILDIPAELRIMILRLVIEYDHPGDDYGDETSGRFKTLDYLTADLNMLFPASPRTSEVYLHAHDWPYGGLLLCNRQLARETAAIVHGLRQNQPGHTRRRALNLRISTDNVGDDTWYATWEGPAWQAVSTTDLEVNLRAECLTRDYYAGRDGDSTRSLVPPKLRFVSCFMDYGPRLGRSMRERRRKTVLNSLTVRLFDTSHMKEPCWYAAAKHFSQDHPLDRMESDEEHLLCCCNDTMQRGLLLTTLRSIKAFRFTRRDGPSMRVIFP